MFINIHRKIQNIIKDGNQIIAFYVKVFSKRIVEIHSDVYKSLILNWKNTTIENIIELANKMKNINKDTVYNELKFLNSKKDTNYVNTVILYIYNIIHLELTSFQLQQKVINIGYYMLEYILNENLYTTSQQANINFLCNQLLVSPYINQEKKTKLFEFIDLNQGSNTHKIDYLISNNVDNLLAKSLQLNNYQSNETKELLYILKDESIQTGLGYIEIINYLFEIIEKYSLSQNNVEIYKCLINCILTKLNNNKVDIKSKYDIINKIVQLFVHSKCTQEWRCMDITIQLFKTICKVFEEENDDMDNKIDSILHEKTVINFIQLISFIFEERQLNYPNKTTKNILCDIFIQYVDSIDDPIQYCQLVYKKS